MVNGQDRGARGGCGGGTTLGALCRPQPVGASRLSLGAHDRLGQSGVRAAFDPCTHPAMVMNANRSFVVRSLERNWPDTVTGI